VRRFPLILGIATVAAFVVPLAAGSTALPVARAASRVAIRDGSTPETAVFPNDKFTVADPRQLSGRRINLPVPTCTSANYSICDGLRLLNQIDGFDLQPRILIPFTGAIQLDSVNSDTVFVQGPDGSRTGLRQIVWNPATSTLTGNTTAFLREDTRYTIVITTGVLDAAGYPIAAGRRVAFTTLSGTTELDRLRKSLDAGTAYQQSGATHDVSFTQGSITTVFPVTDAQFITRNDQVSADPSKPLVSSMVLNSAVTGVGCYAFGSFESPQFVTSDAVIPQVPTTQTPPALSKARLGFAMIVPAGVPPAGGWPVAVYGPGFTRSYFDLFLTSDFNAAAGIATVATDPLGHGFGPASTISVGPPGAVTTFKSYGRGRASDGDGIIGDTEGVQPSDHKTVVNGKVVADLPSHNALVGLRDGLIQTTVDNMALVRSIEHGITVPGCAGQSVPLARTNVEYYGLSFGGIYGTMLLGTDPHVRVGYLNSGGGPIVDIARLSGFRNLLAAQLQVSRPDLLNGGPGLNGFTEDIPLPDDPRITNPHPGSALLAEYLNNAIWLERSGGPEPYAPLLRLRPRYGPKTVEFLNAFGDATVPNFTLGNVIRAGDLFDRLTYYRNDKTPTASSDPHGFLEDPRLAGREPAETQLTAFLASHGNTVLPLPAPVFETPIVNHDNLLCLHYAEPETGGTVYPPSAAGECPPVAPEPHGHPAAGVVVTTSGGVTTATVTGAQLAGAQLAATGSGVTLPALGLAAMLAALGFRRARLARRSRARA